jgi:hypothetical protein
VQTLKEENIEGPDVERTYFTAAGKKIVYGLPKGCRLSTGDGFLLLPQDSAADWEIHVDRSPFTPAMDLAQDVLKYRDSAAEGTPRGATQVQVEQPVMNPYPYNGWKSLGFTWTYSCYGRSMVRTVSYVNLEVGVQVMVTTLATKANAENAGKIARRFMSSWWVKGD